MTKKEFRDKIIKAFDDLKIKPESKEKKRPTKEKKDSK